MYSAVYFSLARFLKFTQIRHQLRFNENVSIGWVQYRITDELLGHRDRLVHGHT